MVLALVGCNQDLVLALAGCSQDFMVDVTTEGMCAKGKDSVSRQEDGGSSKILPTPEDLATSKQHYHTEDQASSI